MKRAAWNVAAVVLIVWTIAESKGCSQEWQGSVGESIGCGLASVVLKLLGEGWLWTGGLI